MTSSGAHVPKGFEGSAGPVPVVAHSAVAASPASRSVSIPFVVIAALLVGAGLFSAMVWLVTFQWIYFAGLGLLVIGGLMLFSPRAGADRAQ